MAVLGGAGWGVYRYTGLSRPGPMVRAEQAMQRGDLRTAQLDLRTLLRDKPDDGAAHLLMAEVQLRLADPVAAEKEAGLAGGPPMAVALLRGRALGAQGQLQKVLDTVPERGGTTAETLAALVIRATAQIGLHKLDDAARTGDAATALAPASPEAALIAAGVATARNDADAEAKVDEALRRDPRQLEALLMKQGFLARRNETDAAVAVLTRALDAAPWSTPARLARAELLMRGGQDAAARKDVDIALSQQRTPLAVYLHAVLLVREQNFQEAERALLALAPMANAIPRVDYYRAVVAGQLGQAQAAQEAAARYVRRVPGDADGVMLLAMIEMVGRRPAQALAALQTLPDGGRTSARAMDLAGQAYAMLGQVAAASDAFARAGALSPADARIASRAGMFAAQTAGAKAGPALDRLAGLAANDPAAEQALVEAALTAGDTERARAALARLRAKVGDTDEVGMLTGAVALAAADLPGAEAAWGAVVARSPTATAARLQLGRVLMLQGRSAEATKAVAPILAQDPANLPTLSFYVPLLIRDGQGAEARTVLEAAAARAPGNPAISLMLAETMRAQGEPGRAVQALTAIPADALSLPLQGVLAQAQADAGKTADAKATLGAMRRAAPGDPEIAFAQLRLAERMKDTDAARTIRMEGLRDFPNNLRFLLTDVAAAGPGTGDAADLELRLRRAEALRAMPRHMPAAAALKGTVLAAARRYKEAVEAFLAEYRQAPSPDLLSRLLGAAFQAGTQDELLPLLRERIAADSGNLQALHAIAEIDLRAGRYAAAQRNLEAILATRRNDPAALNNLALAYQGLKDPRATGMAQLAFMLQPSGATADTLGWLLAQSGEPARALPLLRSAMADQPNDPAVRYHLASTLADAGQQAEALTVVQPLTADAVEFGEKPAALALAAKLRNR